MTFKHNLVVLAAVATAACERPEAITAPVGDPVTQLVVLPKVLIIHPTHTGQLTAFAVTASGKTAPAAGVVTWETSASGVASVNASGFVTAGSTGAATITASSDGLSAGVAVTVAEPQPLASGSCLAQAGPTITLSGAPSPFNDRSLAASTNIDARTATWIGMSNSPVRYGGGSSVCWSGGSITGMFPDGTSWSAYHDAYSLNVYSSPGTVIEGVRIHNYGDGPNFNAAGSDGWTVRGSHLSYIHDDCISNDFGNSGLVEDNLIDGCYVGYSSRAYTGVSDNSTKVVTLRNNLWRLQDMPTGYSSPGHGRFWKMNSSDGTGSDPRLALHDNIFRMDTPANCCGDFLIPPVTYLAACSNNIMVWLGPGEFPEPVPSCFTVTRDQSVWDNAVTDWKGRHPNVAP